MKKLLVVLLVLGSFSAIASNLLVTTLTFDSPQSGAAGNETQLWDRNGNHFAFYCGDYSLKDLYIKSMGGTINNSKLEGKWNFKKKSKEECLKARELVKNATADRPVKIKLSSDEVVEVNVYE